MNKQWDKLKPSIEIIHAKEAQKLQYFLRIPALFFAARFAVPAVLQVITQDNINFTVEKAERIAEGLSSRYLIFTEKETFENTDSIAFLKFNSSNIFSQIDEGKTYRAKVAGKRVPILSLYRNIIEIQEESTSLNIRSLKE